MLFEMAAKYGIPYFSNYVNSDMNPGDVRSMAILGAQEVIYRDKFGRVSKTPIKTLVDTWLNASERPVYQMLMNGEFVDVIDMFQVPYEDYDSYIEINLKNGYKQSFSYDHKCMIVRDGVMMEELSQNVRPDDMFLLARHSYNREDSDSVGNYELGKIVGYYLAEGYQEHNGANIAFAINIERDDIVKDLEKFFDNIGCRVTAKRMDDCSIYKVMVYGRQAYELVGNFISGLSAKEKRLTPKVWDTTASFRCGIYDGYLDTDGSEKNRVFAHTTNKQLCKDIIILGATIGRYFRYYVNSKNTRYFKPDKSDLVHFESYKLDINHPEVFNDDYFMVPVTDVISVPSHSKYVYNFTVDTKDHLYTLPNGIITHQCCRLRLDLTELARKNGGFFGSGESTGSIGVVTVNLPKLAYESKSEEEFYERLDNLMDLIARSLDIKRKVCTELLESGFFPYTKRYLGHFNNHFSTFGVLGMNEAGLNARWLRVDMTDKRTQKWAEDILNHMRSRLIKYQQQYGCLFNLESTPAESTSYRFAKHDKERYPDIKTANDKGTPYYTNSTNLPVGCTADVFEALDVQDNLQILYNSGTVFHTFLGERLYDWESAAKLIRAICTNYRLPYITLSPTYSICTDHGYLVGEHPVCPHCGKKTEVYSRITGYYRAIQNWNDGKTQEFEDRKEYEIDDNVSERRISNYEAVKEAKAVADEMVKGYKFEPVPEDGDTVCESCQIDVDDEDTDSDFTNNHGYVLITTSTCPNCRIVRAFLTQNKPNIDITTIYADITDNAEELAFIKNVGMTVAPVLVTPDGTLISKVSDIIDELKKYC